MLYKRYKMLQKYINGEAKEEYKQGELISEVTFGTLSECNDGNQKPDEPIEGNIYQWVTIQDDYVCNGKDKYTKEKEQSSSDGGATWTDTGRTRQGSLLQANSDDCSVSKQYLTFEALEDSTFKLTSNDINYSLDDGQTWTALRSGTASPTVTAGNKIMWKGTCTTIGNGDGIGTFSSTGTFNVYGNIMSIVYGDDFQNSTVISNGQFKFLFKLAKVVNAENLVLPSTTLEYECYNYMFKVCTSLTTAPELPATKLAERCYENMFEDCISLTKAPELPATTLARKCYNDMFSGCRSLTTAPELPATTLKDYCYALMFNGCKSLNYIKCLATNISASSCLGGWVDGVAETGTFVKAADMENWPKGRNGIPSGWTVINE